MTGRIFEIKRFAVHDGDGIRTTVFFKGCPLRCVWCHNPEGLSAPTQLAYYAHKCIGCGECVRVCPTGAHQICGGSHVLDRECCIGCGACAEACLGDALTLYGKETDVEELLPLLLEDREFYETSGGGVTLSGGECLLQAEFCAALLRRLREEGIHTAVDTCGDVPQEALESVIPYTDVFLYDLKAIDPEVHRRCTGITNERILENLRYLDERGCRIEIRYPFVPDYNDREARAICDFLSTLHTYPHVRVLPYHSFAASKYRALNMESTLPEILPSAEQIKAAEDLLQRH